MKRTPSARSHVFLLRRVIGYSIPLGVLAAAIPATHGADDPVPSPGSIAFPALGVVDMSEGTIESWVKFSFDPQEWHDRYHGRGSLLFVSANDAVADTDHWSISFGSGPNPDVVGKQQMRFLVRFGQVVNGEEVQYPIVTPVALESADEWHHLAITWSGQKVSLYWDGKSVVDAEYRGKIAPSLSSLSRVHIGDSPHRNTGTNHITIDDLRISSIARHADDLGSKGKVEADLSTLLLVNMDGKGSAPGQIKPFVAIIGASIDSIQLPPS